MDGTSQVPPFPGAGKGEGSETTVEIKIKTLDSQTYTLRVNKFVSVPALKEQIANVTGVLSEQQRLICRGKVLKDDELLSAYHVEDGHTLHLVVRQPIDSTSSSSMGMNGANSGSTVPETNPSNRGHNLIFGAVNLSGQGYPSAPDLNRIFSTVVSSLGGNNIDGGSVEIGSRPEQVSQSRGQAENTDSPNPSQMQVDQASTGVEFHHHHQGNSQFPTSSPPTVIPDSLTTLSQYIDHMRSQFDSASSSSSSQASSIGGQVPSIAGQGLPTPAALADVALSTRQLLVEQAARCLSELASQLQNHSTVVDGQARSRIQSHSMRSGVLFQHLGSLLLELGRTITTVRMGQMPDEAVVNAGPAIFISGSSPNPIMVQAAIGLGGSGSPHPGHVLSGGFGGGILSRNIDIRIRRGNSVPAGPNNTETNGSEPSNAQQPSGRHDSSRRSADNIFQRILQGVSSAPPSSGESTVRVVPIRTVIAIPAGVNRPPSDSSGNSDASLHPLFARIQEQLLRGQNHTRDSAGSTGDTSVVHNQLPILDSHLRGSTLDSRGENAERDQIGFPANAAIADPLTSPGTDPMRHPHEIFLSSSTPTEREDGSRSGVTQQHEVSMSEFLDRIGFSTTELEATIDSWRSPSSENGVSGNPERQETLQQDNNQDGSFFASLVRHLMPYISQDSASQDSNPGSQSLSSEHASSSVAEGQHSDDVGNRRDPPNDHAAKRQKRE